MNLKRRYRLISSSKLCKSICQGLRHGVGATWSSGHFSDDSGGHGGGDHEPELLQRGRVPAPRHLLVHGGQRRPAPRQRQCHGQTDRQHAPNCPEEGKIKC